jgi:hypothetical protein
MFQRGGRTSMDDDKIIFTATKEDPNHTYTFEDPFNEISMGDGFILMRISKVVTSLTDKGDLIIFAFINGQEQPVAKDFILFDCYGDKSTAVLKQRKFNEKPTWYYHFDIQKIK